MQLNTNINRIESSFHNMLCFFSYSFALTFLNVVQTRSIKVEYFYRL